MRQRLPFFLLLWAAISTSPAHAQISEKTRAKIMVAFPEAKPLPQPPEEKSPVGTPAPLREDLPLYLLPKHRVEDQRIKGDPDAWLGEKVVQQKAMAEYKDSMTDLEWALNSWYVPLISPPASVRARATYKGKKFADEMNRLGRIANELGKIDPVAGAPLKESLDLSRHPK